MAATGSPSGASAIGEPGRSDSGQLVRRLVPLDPAVSLHVNLENTFFSLTSPISVFKQLYPFDLDVELLHGLVQVGELLPILHVPAAAQFPAVLPPLGHPLRRALDEELRVRVDLQLVDAARVGHPDGPSGRLDLGHVVGRRADHRLTHVPFQFQNVNSFIRA